MKRHILVFLALAPFTAGCEDDVPEPKTPARWEAARPATQPKRGPVSRATSRLRLAVTPSGTPAVDEALAAALMAAGFNVVKLGDDRQQAKVVATVDTSAEATLGGTRRANVTVSADVVGPSGPIARASTTFTTQGDTVAASNLAAIATSLAESPALGGFARDARAAEDDPVRLKAKAEEARQKAEQAKAQADAEWRAANADGCAKAAELGACDALRTWLQRNPSDSRAAAAEAALAEARPRLAALVDERAWKNAEADRCKTPKTSHDCDKVTAYLTVHPKGNHVEDASAIMRQSEKRIAALRQSEERTARFEAQLAVRKAEAERAAEEQQEKQAAREECRRACKQDRCAPYALSAKFQICVARCIQNICE
jgi:hypothetical protein